jgi:uncharacterized protein
MPGPKRSQAKRPAKEGSATRLTSFSRCPYAMSLPVATTITGMDSLEVLHQNLRIAQNFKPFSESELQSLRDRCKQDAADGRYELYKLSLKFDNPEARLAHDFPLDTQQSEVKDMLGAQQNTGHPFPAKQF